MGPSHSMSFMVGMVVYRRLLAGPVQGRLGTEALFAAMKQVGTSSVHLFAQAHSRIQHVWSNIELLDGWDASSTYAVHAMYAEC